MPYYQLQMSSDGNSYQVYADSPEQAKMLASQQLQIPVSQITVRYSSASQIVNAPFLPGTGPGGGGIETGTGDVTGGLEYKFPQAAYERGLQRQGQNPEGFLSDYLESLYRPAAATFGINRAMGGAPTGDLENAFQNYVANTPVGNIRGEATEAFRSLGRPMVSQSQQATLAGYANPYGAGPEGGADEEKVKNLIALAGQAAATRYSPFAARQLLPGGATVRRRYERGGLQGSLYDFLNKQYGLTGGF